MLCHRIMINCLRASRRVLVLPIALALLWPTASVLADAEGTIQYTKRFGGDTVVVEVDWFYVRSGPSLTFGDPRVIWTGVPVPDDSDGSDGLFHTPNGELIVANWQGNSFVKLNPNATDDVLEGPVDGTFPFHTLLHPNLDDFLAAPAFSDMPTCATQDSDPIGCFEVLDHTPLTQGVICATPPESASGDSLQPHTFIADENLNMFVLYSDNNNIQFGGAGFASFDLADTDSTMCSGDMSMTSLIPPEIDAAHSISWSPFLSDANAAVAATQSTESDTGPHSDFIVFANSRIGHIRVMNPGTANATAEVVSEVDFTSESACAMLLPAGEHEFDQGAVTGSGIALVADEHTPYLALLDYSQNQNGSIRDPENMVCLVAHLDEGIDDIAPLTGLGARDFFGPGNDGSTFPINPGHSGAYYEPRTAGQGFLAEFVPAQNSPPALEASATQQDESEGFAFVSWFTYTPENSSNPFELQWYTMQGDYSGDRAQLVIYETLGGKFDATDPVDTNPVGTATWIMNDCKGGELLFNFDDGRQGAVPFTRVIPGSENICEDQAGASLQTVDINAGMDGAWYEPATAGQGFFIDAHPSAAAQTNGTEASTGFIFVAWYSYGKNTASGQQWYTAQGDFAGSRAEIEIYETSGGSFDDPRATDTNKVGTMNLDFTDCKNVKIAYAFDGGPTGDIDATRVVPDAETLCNSVARPLQQSE